LARYNLHGIYVVQCASLFEPLAHTIIPILLIHTAKNP